MTVADFDVPPPNAAEIHMAAAHDRITSADVVDALEEVLELLEGYVDVVDGEHGPQANKAMRAVHLIEEVLGEEGRMTLAKLLQPPPPTVHEVLAGEARERRIADAKAKAMDEVMSGTGAFWADWRVADHWDNEQHIPIALAVGQALADASLTGDQFKAKVMAAVLREGMKYAAAVASDVE